MNGRELVEGAILGERKVRETYLDGLEKESFTFELRQVGNVLLNRRWHFDGTGGKLFVKLNGVEQTWDLSKGNSFDRERSARRNRIRAASRRNSALS